MDLNCKFCLLGATLVSVQTFYVEPNCWFCCSGSVQDLSEMWAELEDPPLWLIPFQDFLVFSSFSFLASFFWFTRQSKTKLRGFLHVPLMLLSLTPGLHLASSWMPRKGELPYIWILICPSPSELALPTRVSMLLFIFQYVQVVAFSILYKFYRCFLLGDCLVGF